MGLSLIRAPASPLSRLISLALVRTRVVPNVNLQNEHYSIPLSLILPVGSGCSLSPTVGDFSGRAHELLDIVLGGLWGCGIP
ncbi:uncharacterized protein LAJ45_01020 [Morchella importuna]|uniref:uncharacterized protein n=1 Tax=Morchella importuna TaxID=1174673 RepID=UPI001E8D4349|nr:uncharacterized protein LAJ45_01020 [Morchella importuna]KAH8154492.1 hypothetical protein LAJ45_01020 [Morchella importuna]